MPLKLRFTSDEYGQIALPRKVGWVAVNRGIALEIRDKIEVRSAVTDGLDWYRFRAVPLGYWANKVELAEEEIVRFVDENPDMICSSWNDILAESAHLTDFRRLKRPFIKFAGNAWPVGVIWGFHAEIGRLGVYIGKDARGLGGYVTFLDEERFALLVAPQAGPRTL